MISAKDHDRIAFLHAPDATLLLSERKILKANLMVEAVFGWSPAELEGQSIRVLYPGQTDFEVIGDRARRSMEKHPFYSDTRFMLHRSGRLIWMAARGTAIEREDPYRLAVWSYRPLETEEASATKLTKTELKVASYLVNGFTSKEIGLALNCSPRTVEVHRAKMMRTLNVRNASELIRKLLGTFEHLQP